MDEIVDFGKAVNGETIGDAISMKPKYILWCLNNIEDFELSDDLMEHLDEQLARVLY